MKTSSLFGILLFVSIGLNVYLWIKHNKDYSDCHSTPGFEMPSRIDNASAKGLINQYSASLQDGDSVIGGVISRSAFDQILCTKECNAIYYSFALDSTGTYGPGGNNVFVLFSGVHASYDSTTGTITEIRDLMTGNYFTRNWCPTSCKSY